jgi:hypothetical protein
MAANRRRGEISATLDGREWRLCLTLGALAELETAFGVDDLSQLAQRFAGGRLAARDIIAIVGAGLRGGGGAVSDAEVAAMAIDDGVAGFARLTAELLQATFASGDEAGSSEDPAAPRQATRTGFPGTS